MKRLIGLVALAAFAAILPFLFPQTAKAMENDDAENVKWAIDCYDKNIYNGYMDTYGGRKLCVPGMVSNESWFTPSPKYQVGYSLFYAPGAMEETAKNRGMSLKGFKGGVSLQSPADIGEVVWLKRPDNNTWEGPFLVIDCAQRNHIYSQVVHIGEVVEVDFKTALQWGMVKKNINYSTGKWTWEALKWKYEGVEVWKGFSPPPTGQSIEDYSAKDYRTFKNGPVNWREEFKRTVTFTDKYDKNQRFTINKFPDLKQGIFRDKNGNPIADT